MRAVVAAATSGDSSQKRNALEGWRAGVQAALEERFPISSNKEISRIVDFMELLHKFSMSGNFQACAQAAGDRNVLGKLFDEFIRCLNAAGTSLIS